MSNLRPLQISAGKVCTVDDEIAHVERLVEQNRVEHMVNLVLEDLGGGIHKAYIMTLGTPLPRVRDMLTVAQQAVDDMIGKEKT